MMDDLIERIDNARGDADYWVKEGKPEKAVVTLSLDDCDMLGKFLTEAFGAVMMGKQDMTIADKLAVLAGAFEGEQDDEDD